MSSLRLTCQGALQICVGSLSIIEMVSVIQGRTPHLAVASIPNTKRILRRSHCTICCNFKNEEQFSDLLRRSDIPRKSLPCDDLVNNFYIDPTSLSLDAHRLSTGIHVETLTAINQIASLKSHLSNVNAVFWYIKHECNCYTSAKFPHSLTLILQ
jgi:hypothetical protein